MIYLPDTNVCISYLRKKSTQVTRKFQSLSPADIALCDNVKAELWYGAHHSGHFDANRVLLETFFAPFISLPFDSRAAEVYGRIRRELEVVGRPIGPYDLQIAAIALVNDLILVTHNTRKFSRINDLQIEDWEV
jgi:tRNA(fMet)-specific endonuclease VapC